MKITTNQCSIGAQRIFGERKEGGGGGVVTTEIHSPHLLMAPPANYSNFLGLTKL